MENDENIMNSLETIKKQAVAFGIYDGGSYEINIGTK